MKNDTPSLAELEIRLGKLERQSRRLKRLGLLFLLIAASGFLLAQASCKRPGAAPGAATPAVTYDTLVVHHLELRDKAGTLRGVWEVEDEIPRLRLYDTAGKPRAALAVSASGPTLVLYDAAGKGRATLGVTDAGPGLVLLDAAEKPRAALAVTADAPGLALSDAAEKPRAVLTEDGLWPR
jgi:hypothetical protein